ncbi:MULTISPECIES: hypothetical protein [unclassified Roseitalea]|uniref:hypothetical protein n=1 Tax=unclassified Roseitalea TaxID=2639107 RepID=UPI00273F8222|nr:MULTISPECIES: hypothetical protein [unclassified Roseitalea]
METIKLYYKLLDVESTDRTPYYHKYIIYTDSNGDRFYARSGPNWLVDGKFVKITSEYGAYVQGTKDWDDPPNDPSETIKTGSDLSTDWQAIVDAMDDIDQENWTYLPERNSNSAVDTALDRAGLNQPVLDGPNDYESPGSGNILPAQVQTPPLPQPKPDWINAPESAFGDAETEGSPLVLDLDSDGIELTTFNAATTTTFFDVDGDGFAEQTAWVSADDGLRWCRLLRQWHRAVFDQSGS